VEAGHDLDVESMGINGDFSMTGGTLSVDTFNGTLNQSGGTLSPGDSPGITNIVGDYNLTGTGILDIEILSPGLTAGVDFDQVLVSGNATLDGTIAFNFVGDDSYVVPDWGITFLIADLAVSPLNPGDITFTLTGLDPLLGLDHDDFEMSYISGNTGVNFGLPAGPVIPEPATMVMFGLAGLGMAVKRFGK